VFLARPFYFTHDSWFSIQLAYKIQQNSNVDHQVILIHKHDETNICEGILENQDGGNLPEMEPENV